MTELKVDRMQSRGDPVGRPNDSSVACWSARASHRLAPTLGLFLLLASSFTWAASPQLNELRPRGAQGGKPFALSLVGSGLSQDCKVLSTLPAFFTPLSASGEEAGGGEDVLPFLVELRTRARVGFYPVRVQCSDGLSNVLLFSLGIFPETQEEESRAAVHRPVNDSPANSQVIQSFPVTINGTLQGPDRDVYRVSIPRGQRLVFEVEARRAGSAVDPVVRVLDSWQRQIGINDDAPALDVDSRLDLSFSEAGEYYVVVHDARFSEQEQNFYRLKIGTFNYADGIFPLGWQRGEKTIVKFHGGNVPTPAHVEVDLTTVDPADPLTLVWPPGGDGSSPFVFALSDSPEMIEPSDGEPVTLDPGTILNGRISRPGEVDHYRLAVRPGQRWMLEVQAADLGTSDLSAVLTVQDERGVRIASAGDEIPDPDVFALISPGASSSDPHLNFEVPENVHHVTVAIEDLLRRGGTGYGYRLWANPQPPDFTLTLVSPYVNIPIGGVAAVTVNAIRRGYMGPIQLRVEGGGSDLAMDGGYIPGEVEDPDNRKLSRTGMLTLAAEDGARLRTGELSVWGEGMLEDGTVIRRRAQGPGLVTRVFGGTGVHDPNNRDRQQPFVAPWLGFELPVMVREEIPARLEVEAPRHVRLLQGGEYDFRWNLQTTEPGVRPPRQVGVSTPGARDLRITRRNADAQYEKSGTFTLVTTVGTPPSTFNVIVSGEADIQGRRETIYAPAITVEVVQGYTLNVPSSGLILTPGGEGVLAGTVERDPLFDQPVSIRPENFPEGVVCRAVEVSGSEKNFQVLCRADHSTQPGEYGIDLVSSSILGGRDKEKVPYSIDPIKARLVISAERQVSRTER